MKPLLYLILFGALFTVSGQDRIEDARSFEDSLRVYNLYNLKFIYQGNLKAADSINSIGESLLKKQSAPIYGYLFKRNKGLSYIFKPNYDSAFTIFTDLSVQASIEDNEPIYYKSKLYQGLTRLYLTRIDQAKKDFEEVISYNQAQMVIDSLTYGFALSNLGLLEYTAGNLEDAEKKLLKANEILQSEDYMMKIARTECLNLLAALYRSKGDLKISYEYYRETFSLYNQTNRLLNKPIFLTGFAQLFLELSNKDAAFRFLDMAQHIADSLGQMRESAFVYQIKAKCFEEIGQYRRALDNYKQFSAIEDSLTEIEKNSEIQNIAEEAERELESLRLNTLEQQLEIQRKSNERQKTWIFLIVMVCIYLSGSVLVFYRMVKQKNVSHDILESKNHELEIVNNQIKKTQDKLIKSEKMALLGRISAGIAHELNTPIGAIKGNLELINDAQRREVDTFSQIYGSITKEDFELMLQLVVESVRNNQVYQDTEKEQSIRKYWIDFLKDQDIPEKDDVIDLMTDLKIDTEPERFLQLMKNKLNVSILEFALFINNRYSSIKTALEALNRAQKILSSFKTYSFKRGWEDYKEFDLKQNLETILDLHKNILKEVEVNMEVEGETVLRGVPDELSQVWTNLITNAVYAMDYKGELNIRLSESIEDILLTIEDTGGGIAATQDEIFEPFYTTKPEGEGSGLGLDISRQIILKHDGSIKWENTNRGVKFIIVLPKSKESTTIQNG